MPILDGVKVREKMRGRTLASIDRRYKDILETSFKNRGINRPHCKHHIDGLCEHNTLTQQMLAKLVGLCPASIATLCNSDVLQPFHTQEEVESSLEAVLGARPQEFRARDVPCLDSPLSPAGDPDLLKLAALEHFPNNQINRIAVISFPRLGSSTNCRVYRLEVELGDHIIYNKRYLFTKIGTRNYIKREEGKFIYYNNDHTKNNYSLDSKCISYKNHLCMAFSLRSKVDDTYSVPDSLDNRMKSVGPAKWAAGEYCRALLDLFQPPTRFEDTDLDFGWFSHYTAMDDGRTYLNWEKVNQTITRDLVSIARDRPGLASPLKLIESLRTDAAVLRVPVRLTQVHGDLHQRNIILQSTSDGIVAWPIDFDWSRPFHAMVDYTLMEASLKMFYYARYIHPDRYLPLHDRLDAESPDLNGLDTVERTLIKFLRALRVRSQGVCRDQSSWRIEYYLSSFLVTLGQLPNSGCSAVHAWLTLSWLAGKLRELQDRSPARRPNASRVSRRPPPGC